MAGNENATLEALPAIPELRKLNEELETAIEELWSINEEVTKANQALLSTVRPFLVLGAALGVITANQSFERVFGLSPGEVEGEPLYSISGGSWNIPRLREMLERILADSNAAPAFEIEQVFPGVGRKVRAITARQLGGGQQILLDIKDVTELRERAGYGLRESEERFRMMADSAPVMVWASGTDKACNFFNKPWLAFAGRSLEQELSNGCSERVHPEDLDRCLQIYMSSFDARSSFQMEYRLRRFDGDYRWVLTTGGPRFDHNGVFAGYIGSCIDITGVRPTEEDVAKQKLETVGALAAGIAHDLGNILGGILAHSEVALTEVAGGSSPTEELQRIRAGALRGAEIAQQLMVYTGQERESLELVDVAEIVEDMLELLHVAVSKHAKVETGFGEDLPLVRASPTQIRQVAMNLITNASEAIGDRDGLIRVTTGRVMIGGGPVGVSAGLAEWQYLQLEVSDTGRGMSPEVQAKIFDPFFTTKAAGSHGRGLVVVKRIVQSLNGTIQVVSAAGKGATFRILLPAESDAVRPGRGAVLAPKAEAFEFREATILIVDDEDPLRQAVSKMLRKQGLSVIEATDVALDVIRTEKVHLDLLLLDVTLPGASSREIYEEAKYLRPGLPVIVASAKTEEMAAAALATRMNRFLRKPYRLVELLSAIRDVLPAEPRQGLVTGCLKRG